MRRTLVPAFCLIALGWTAPAFAQENRECQKLREMIRIFDEQATEIRQKGNTRAEEERLRASLSSINQSIAWLKARPNLKQDRQGFTMEELLSGRRELIAKVDHIASQRRMLAVNEEGIAETRARGKGLGCNGMDGSVRAAPPWARSGAPVGAPANTRAKPWERGSGGTPPASSASQKPWARSPAAPQTPPPPQPNDIQLDMLGSVWTESENGWSGQWVRRGKTNTFDATWTNGWTVKATLTITISGTRVSVYRVNASDNNSCNYEGTLNGMNVSGTYRCTSGGGSWSATIR